MSIGTTSQGGTVYIYGLVTEQAAATATTVHPLFTAPAACTVYGAVVNSAAAVTGADTHTRHLNLRDNGTEFANIDWVAGTDHAANTEDTLYTSATGRAMAAGDILDIQSEKVGNGLANPAWIVRVALQWT